MITVYWPERHRARGLQQQRHHRPRRRPRLGHPRPQGRRHRATSRLLKNQLLPPFDLGSSALIEDLRARGRLDDTLVIWTGEFGRSPRVNPDAGRDHYGNVFSLMMAGGGDQAAATSTARPTSSAPTPAPTPSTPPSSPRPSTTDGHPPRDRDPRRPEPARIGWRRRSRSRPSSGPDRRSDAGARGGRSGTQATREMDVAHRRLDGPRPAQPGSGRDFRVRWENHCSGTGTRAPAGARTRGAGPGRPVCPLVEPV